MGSDEASKSDRRAVGQRQRRRGGGSGARPAQRPPRRPAGAASNASGRPRTDATMTVAGMSSGQRVPATTGWAIRSREGGAKKRGSSTRALAGHRRGGSTPRGPAGRRDRRAAGTVAPALAWQTCAAAGSAAGRCEAGPGGRGGQVGPSCPGRYAVIVIRVLLVGHQELVRTGLRGSARGRSALRRGRRCANGRLRRGLGRGAAPGSSY